jgi:hypothetical protein
MTERKRWASLWQKIVGKVRRKTGTPALTNSTEETPTPRVTETVTLWDPWRKRMGTTTVERPLPPVIEIPRIRELTCSFYDYKATEPDYMGVDIDVYDRLKVVPGGQSDPYDLDSVRPEVFQLYVKRPDDHNHNDRRP